MDAQPARTATSTRDRVLYVICIRKLPRVQGKLQPALHFANQAIRLGSIEVELDEQVAVARLFEDTDQLYLRQALQVVAMHARDAAATNQTDAHRRRHA